MQQLFKRDPSFSQMNHPASKLRQESVMINTLSNALCSGSHKLQYARVEERIIGNNSWRLTKCAFIRNSTFLILNLTLSTLAMGCFVCQIHEYSKITNIYEFNPFISQYIIIPISSSEGDGSGQFLAFGFNAFNFKCFRLKCVHLVGRWRSLGYLPDNVMELLYFPITVFLHGCMFLNFG